MIINLILASKRSAKDASVTRKAEKNRHNISRALKPRNAKLRAAVSAAVLAMSGPISTLAEVTKPIQIDLRPQRLKSALNTISETYEVPIIVPGEVLQNLDSPAVSGQLTTDEVLLIILDGSGLKANRSSSGAILISPVKKTIEKVVPEPGDAAQPAEPTTVEEIVVSGSRYYTPITNLTRSPASLSEISNSLTLISNDVIQDQLLLTLQDILDNVAGYQERQVTSALQRNLIIGIRGVTDSRVPSIVRENSLSGGVNYRPDPYSIERVEVIKGPSAISGGGAPVGGLINRILKSAVPESRNEAFFAADSYGQVRGGVDINQPLTEAGNVFGRVVVAGITGDLPYQRTDYESIQVTPSLLFDNGGNTVFSLHGNFFQNGGAPPSLPSFPPSLLPSFPPSLLPSFPPS
ncbi:MAG: TonB-dependent receptor plug domain-containing protein, partial [Pseudomonadota bacterium]